MHLYSKYTEAELRRGWTNLIWILRYSDQWF